MKADVAIVGAGIAGSALAYHLSGEGLHVTLLDGDYPGLGASGRSAGLLTSQHWNRFDVALTRASQEMCDHLARDEEGGVQRVGFLRVTSLEEDIPVMRERVHTYLKEGVMAEFLEGEELSSRFPSIDSSGLLAGVFTPQDGYVDAYDITSTFASLARERGVAMAMGNKAKAVEMRSSKAVGVETPQGELSAEAVVVAAGAWTPSLLRESGTPLPLKPYRTQALVTAPVTDLPILPMFHELPRGLYLRPDQDGLLLGNGTEHDEADPGGYNTHADFELYAKVAAWATERVPAAKDARIARGWAGLCVATPDRFPLVGEVEEVEGLFVLAGFNGLGVMRGPPLARSLAEALLGRRPTFELAPFHPGRFEGRDDFRIREGFTLR